LNDPGHVITLMLYKDSYCKTESFLNNNVFMRVPKIAINDCYVRHIRPSVRMEQLGSQLTDFHVIFYLHIFRKTAKKIQVLLKSDKNEG
jgi:hypothetical protein